MTRLLVGPFNRVEGDLEVRLELDDGRVREAFVTSTLYRGFETMLNGRAPMDALTIVPRVCGICSLSQSVAAARALAALAGAEPPPNGVHAVNLMSGTENLADHLAHFYLFFMPDFTRPAYAARPWFAEAQRRFAPGAGTHARRAIAARQRWFTLMGTLGGKWPMSGSVSPGGSACAVQPHDAMRLLALVREFRAFAEETLFGAPLEEVTGLADERALDRWLARDARAGDLRLFIEIARDASLDALGRGPGRYLSYGAYPQVDGGLLVPRGVWHESGGTLEPLPLDDIAEDLTHAWMRDEGGDELGHGVRHDTASPRVAPPRHPRDGLTVPAPDKPGAYTWNKAPRLGGRVVETGAIARQLAAGQPLVRDAVARCRANVYTRVLARLLEIAVMVPKMEQWLSMLAPREPFFAPVTLPDDGSGVGLAEAARGALGHWITVRRGRIANYQIIAPTSWNFSPRDAAGTPGALEAALAGTPVEPGDAMPVAVQHIVRSFDPCMVCTVH